MSLFQSIKVGALTLPNRIVMAPMTRGRANGDGVPHPRMAVYYAQRASAGLLITEGVFISPQAVGWVNAPGIYTDAQIEGWKSVTNAVHEKNGRIFLQLWHMGRVSHPNFQNGSLPVGPSAIAAEGETFTPAGKCAYVTPHELTASEIAQTVADFAQAAKNAIAAGFDGVEIHGANGYLVDEFIRDGSNKRTDEFGGSIEKRWKFPLQVVQAVVNAVGAEKTAIRLSPVGGYNTMSDSDPQATFTYGVSQLNKFGLAFLHVLEAGPGHMMYNENAPVVHPHLRKAFQGPFLLNGGQTKDSAEAAMASGAADFISFGVPFLANPDLVNRLKKGDALAMPDFAKLYGGDESGYTDYPALE
ncbi:mitochondrial alkene reductase (12-oxophytodienoic acid reductase) [Andalucia godoyi]|uniref:Mitochondrial alkene reductase (12-oxophytodienoic acid reductase) n=1 Tax=Andalucia godoyi TaxID=505711 RepID=A0A8K0AH43_ANDGO|nr:mitochondrial alkene reductase (12-oxophytodienoic acid reductase) [Andalucia godoyi]|eukprot:ANDGO_05910.mRNA.1 mitochondrial alkene reductase (12-oxophytodienoic acid reductase)